MGKIKCFRYLNDYILTNNEYDSFFQAVLFSSREQNMIKNENSLLANSIWSATSNKKIIGNKVMTSQDFDIVIIGGGLSGVSVAFHCAKLGLKACLLEKQTIGWGASGRNGGQVIPGLKELPEQVLNYFGKEMGKKIIALAGSAPDYVFDLIKMNNIDCSASQNGWIQASITNAGLDTNKSLVRQWKEYGAPVELLSTPEIRSLIGSDTYSSGILDLRGGKLHPLNYVIGLAHEAQNAGIPIFQECPVTSIKSKNGMYEINCPEGLINAEKVVLTTNAYGDLKTGTINRNIIPVQSVQVATAPLSDNVLKTILPKGQVVSDTRRLLKYFRIAEDGRLLMGGRGGVSNRGTSIQIKNLKHSVKEMFPFIGEIKYDYSWGGNVALTLDHFPQISVFKNGIISLSGYNGRGVALTTVLGKVVAEFLNQVPEKDLNFPIQKLKSIPFPKYHNMVLPFATWYKKLLDSVEK